MKNRDHVIAAMDAFVKQLPDPKLSNTPTISADVEIKGERVRFMAQRVKGLKGLTWKVYPMNI